LKKNSNKSDKTQIQNNLVSFEEVLAKKLCKYIAGDLKKGTAKFCSNPMEKGKPYCAAHAELCLLKPPKINEDLIFKK